MLAQLAVANAADMVNSMPFLSLGCAKSIGCVCVCACVRACVCAHQYACYLFPPAMLSSVFVAPRALRVLTGTHAFDYRRPLSEYGLW